MAEQAASSRESLLAATERPWYHTIELAPGIVTPGWFDHREIRHKLPFPPSMAGMRCLDVATADGFWAFEMERRGADEVVAVDILDPEAWDWPANTPPGAAQELDRRKEGGRGFRIASEALGSDVRYLESSVYDLTPEEVGEFDFVYLGSLLLHLRDPVLALQRVREVCRGALLVVDAISLPLTLFHRQPMASLDGYGRPWWWKANLAGLVRMLDAAGFRLVQRPKRFYMPPGKGHFVPPLDPRLLFNEEARHFLLTRIKGDPHAALLARRA